MFLSANQIVVTFSENIVGIANDSFSIEQDGQVVAIASVTVPTNNTAIITLGANLEAGSTVTVKKGANVAN